MDILKKYPNPLTYPSLGIDSSSSIKQGVDHVDAAPLSSDMQWRDVISGCMVNRRAPLQEKGGYVDVTVVGCNVERGESTLWGGGMVIANRVRIIADKKI